MSNKSLFVVCVVVYVLFLLLTPGKLNHHYSDDNDYADSYSSPHEDGRP